MLLAGRPRLFTKESIVLYAETRLRQLFQNNFNCWASKGTDLPQHVDASDILDTMAMDEDKFVEVVSKLLYESKQK